MADKDEKREGAMFKTFTAQDVSSQNQAKSSITRGIRASVLELYPRLEPVIDELLPKKPPTVLGKAKDHIQLVLVGGEAVFYQQRDGPVMPTLRTIHKYPTMMHQVQVDRGAIRFVLKGANIMCPGLTSPGAYMEDGIPAGAIVAVMAEGKEHACAVGQMTMSSDDIKKVNKDMGVANIHYLNDGLWKCKSFD
jgi:PUA domain protein